MCPYGEYYDSMDREFQDWEIEAILEAHADVEYIKKFILTAKKEDVMNLITTCYKRLTVIEYQEALDRKV